MSSEKRSDQGSATLTVVDHLEIQQLYARYSHTIDGHHGKAFADTFTPDGVWSQGFTAYRGQKDLAEFARTSYALYGGYKHFQANILLEPDGDKVNGSSYLMFVIPGTLEEPPIIAATGSYHDVLVKLPVGWRFASREVVLDKRYTAPEPAVMPNPEGVGGPSQRFKDFIEYLKVTPPVVSIEALRAPSPKGDLSGASLQQIDVGGVPAFQLSPGHDEPERTILYFHGGGYVTGSPPTTYFAFAAKLAVSARARVIVSDYRLAPEAPFPAAYDDGLASYRWLVGPGGVDPKMLCLVGDSAGAGLAVAVALGAKNEGLALPAAIGMISPFADMSLSGATINDPERDPFVAKELVEFMATNYVGEGDRRDPRCSPVFADLKGLPPLYIQVGDREILYDDAVRIAKSARSAGVDVLFEPWKHMIHIWPVMVGTGFPESKVAIDRMATFIKGHTNLSLL